MGVFDKFSPEDIRRAEGNAKTIYMTEIGEGLVRIVRHVIGGSKKSKGAKIKCVIEFEIVTPAASWVKHPKGARRAKAYLIDPSDSETCDTKLGLVKAHFEAVSGTPQSEIDNVFLDDVEDNPYKYEGVLVRLEIGEPFESKRGFDINPFNWYPYNEEGFACEEEPQHPDQIEEEDIAF